MSAGSHVGLEVVHSASIAGCVREQPPAGGLRALHGELRVAGALVEIVAGPPEFEALRAAQAAAQAAGARLRRPRCDRAYSQADGIYLFTDLPPGDYRLRVSAPKYGTRFGSVESAQPIAVLPPPAPGGRWQAAAFDVLLPSTRVRGVVRRADTDAAVGMATVRVRGEAAAVRTDGDGRFELHRLPAGRITLDIAAAGMFAVQQTFTVAAGEEAVIPDIRLSRQTPEQAGI